MRFYTVALLTGATAVAAGNTANLLLPGFEGHDLQAGVLNKVCFFKISTDQCDQFAQFARFAPTGPCSALRYHQVPRGQPIAKQQWKYFRLTRVSGCRYHHLPGDLPLQRRCHCLRNPRQRFDCHRCPHRSPADPRQRRQVSIKINIQSRLQVNISTNNINPTPLGPHPSLAASQAPPTLLAPPPTAPPPRKRL